MGLTNDRNDPNLRIIKSDGQQASYLVLSDEETRQGVRSTRPPGVHPRQVRDVDKHGTSHRRDLRP
jgi:hypothetical protein